MNLHKHTRDRRTLGVIGAAALVGAAWAIYSLWRVGGNSSAGPSTALIWAVFTTPFAAFWGWLLVRRAEGWSAALVCFCIYFFGVLVSARIERLVLGADAAGATGHALYYRLTIAIQLVACVAVAIQRSGKHGTMPVSTDAGNQHG
jgi:hypothetical protein